VITCEYCPWQSAEESTPSVAELRLLDHARAAHAGIRADTIATKIRSRKYHFKIEAEVLSPELVMEKVPAEALGV